MSVGEHAAVNLFRPLRQLRLSITRFHARAPLPGQSLTQGVILQYPDDFTREVAGIVQFRQ